MSDNALGGWADDTPKAIILLTDEPPSYSDPDPNYDHLDVINAAQGFGLDGATISTVFAVDPGNEFYTMAKETGGQVFEAIDDEVVDAIKNAVAFVKKPFDPEKLIGIVKNTIG